MCSYIYKKLKQRREVKEESKNHHLGSDCFGEHLSRHCHANIHVIWVHTCSTFIHKDTSVFAHAHCYCVLFEWIHLLSTF